MSTIDLRNIKKDDMIIPPHGESGYRTPRGFRLVDEREAQLTERLTNIEKQLSVMAPSTPNDNINVVSYSVATANLDSRIQLAQATCYPDGTSSMEGDEMAKHRLRYVAGYDDNGQPIVKQVSGDTETALADALVKAIIKSERIQEFLPDLVQRMTNSADETPKEKHRMRDYAEYWRQTYKQGIAKTTAALYDAKQSVILRYFGNMFVEDIRPDDVQRFLTDRAKSLSKKTVKEDWAHLKMILDSAVSDDIILKNPAKDIRLDNSAEDGEGTKALTKEQMAAIRRDLTTLRDDNERCFLALLAYTSMRREEALGLQWEDVDFDNGQINICRALAYPRNVPQLKCPKTKTGKRTIPISGQLGEILRACRRDSGFIICNEDGKPLSSKRYYAMWKSISSQIDLYGATAKNFRTTFATLSVAADVDIKTTQALMGHADPSMTLRVYTKVEQSKLPVAVQRLDDFIQA